MPDVWYGHLCPSAVVSFTSDSLAGFAGIVTDCPRITRLFGQIPRYSDGNSLKYRKFNKIKFYCE